MKYIRYPASRDLLCPHVKREEKETSANSPSIFCRACATISMTPLTSFPRAARSCFPGFFSVWPFLKLYWPFTSAAMYARNNEETLTESKTPTKFVLRPIHLKGKSISEGVERSCLLCGIFICKNSTVFSRV